MEGVVLLNIWKVCASPHTDDSGLFIFKTGKNREPVRGIRAARRGRRLAYSLTACFVEDQPAAVGRELNFERCSIAVIATRTSGQLETFGSGAKIPLRQSPAGGREALPEGVVWLVFHSATR